MDGDRRWRWAWCIDGTPVYGTTSEIDGRAEQETAAGALSLRSLSPDWRCCRAYRLRAHALDRKACASTTPWSVISVMAAIRASWVWLRLPHRWH